jgi:hypothetical protein
MEVCFFHRVGLVGVSLQLGVASQLGFVLQKGIGFVLLGGIVHQQESGD